MVVKPLKLKAEKKILKEGKAKQIKTNKQNPTPMLPSETADSSIKW
jgi:hypothetical protein